MNNKKWGIVNSDSDLCYVVLYVSRSKDNKDLPDFAERRKSFICTPDMIEHYTKAFTTFVNEGLTGELSRMYISVNARHLPTIRKQLMHFLIDATDFNLCAIQSKIAGIAAQKECAAERKWLIDFDSTDNNALLEMTNWLSNLDDTLETQVYRTPNGYAVIVNHGFDLRDFTERYNDVATIKRDDMLCLKWQTKE